MSNAEIETRGLGAGSYPEPPVEKEIPLCPVCGEACQTLYFCGDMLVGCDDCVETRDAWEVQYG